MPARSGHGARLTTQRHGAVRSRTAGRARRPAQSSARNDAGRAAAATSAAPGMPGHRTEHIAQAAETMPPPPASSRQGCGRSATGCAWRPRRTHTRAADRAGRRRHRPGRTAARADAAHAPEVGHRSAPVASAQPARDAHTDPALAERGWQADPHGVYARNPDAEAPGAHCGLGGTRPTLPTTCTARRSARRPTRRAPSWPRAR